ncbi:hypothetical protein ACS0TY_025808 [Phlomoides rotata]
MAMGRVKTRPRHEFGPCGVGKNPVKRVPGWVWTRSNRSLPGPGVNALRVEFVLGGAVLDCCFYDDTLGFSACADHTVRRHLFNNSREDILGRHGALVRCIEYSNATGKFIVIVSNLHRRTLEAAMCLQT